MPKPRVLVIALVCLIVAFMIFGRRKKAASSIKKPVVAQPATQVLDPKEKHFSSKIPPTIVAQQQHEALGAKIGLLGVPLAASKQGSTLQVQLKIQSACHYGDVDGILAELKDSGRAHLFLTIEALSNKSHDGDHLWREISSDELQRGLTTSFQLPAPAEANNYALSICTDLEGRNKCAGKPLADINQILRDANTPKAPRHRAEGKLFFFQYLIINASEAQILTVNPKNDKAFKILQQYGGEEKIPRDGLAYGLSEAKQTLPKLASLPLSREGNSLVITLPRMTKECNERARQVLPQRR